MLQFFDGIPQLSRFMKTMDGSKAQQFLHAAARKHKVEKKTKKLSDGYVLSNLFRERTNLNLTIIYLA